MTTGTFDIWCLGITTVIGGQYFAWNAGLAAGFGSELISTLIMGSGYLCLVYCIMETTSALPFAGAFGLARCTIGFYAGFIIASIEALEYITYTATSALALSSMIIQLMKIDVIFTPLLCFLFYFTALIVHVRGGWVFWRVNSVLAIVSILIIIVYIFGSLKFVNFTANAGLSDKKNPQHVMYFMGDGKAFMKGFPLAAWFFIGIESLGFCYNMVKDVSLSLCLLNLFFEITS